MPTYKVYFLELEQPGLFIKACEAFAGDGHVQTEVIKFGGKLALCVSSKDCNLLASKSAPVFGISELDVHSYEIVQASE